MSGAMMLEWLGEARAAAVVRAALERALAEKSFTPDLGGKLTTMGLTDRIVERVAM